MPTQEDGRQLQPLANSSMTPRGKQKPKSKERLMIGRKSVIGIAVLCALALSAFASASASAAGTAGTAFLCEKTGTATFSDEHCLTAKAGGEGFKHTEIKAGVATAITGTNAKTASSTTASTPAVLAGTIAGLATELSCTTVNGTGSLTNVAEIPKEGEKEAVEMHVDGSGIITYTGCTVVKPAGRECKVKEGKVVTKTLTATTLGQAAKNKLKFEGQKIEVEPGKFIFEFAGITIEGCKENTPPAATYPVTGSLIATTSGATTTTTEAEITTQNTLKFGGNKAGLGGSLTLSKKEGSPLVLT